MQTNILLFINTSFFFIFLISLFPFLSKKAWANFFEEGFNSPFTFTFLQLHFVYQQLCGTYRILSIGNGYFFHFQRLSNTLSQNLLLHIYSSKSITFTLSLKQKEKSILFNILAFSK